MLQPTVILKFFFENEMQKAFKNSKFLQTELRQPKTIENSNFT